ncbi:MAG TPA: protein-disulfide reductase DsbD domain-containing protein [Candidatus Acidoferrales bacterium]|nr:protein-disulfide reductase DsbD domain-containing protein [Candidatus Acidoferrales bacterium]
MNHRDTQDTETRGIRAQRTALFALAAFCFVAAAAPGRPQDTSRPLKAADAVRTQVYVSLAPVPQGRKFEIAAVAQVAPGYHVQANKVLEEYLIPLTVTPELPPGFRLLDTTYPKAQLKKFPFAAKPMAVYEGRFLVRMKLAAEAGAPAGPVKIPMTLRFQACNDELCLPPARLPLTAEFTVAPAGSPAKSTHPEIFGKQ